MNKGTKLRTIFVVASCLNTALIATDVAQFGNEAVNTIYRILSVILNFVIVACATYYNNDYTDEASLGTGYARQLKAEKKADYVGEAFFGEDELAQNEEVGDDGEQDNL